MQCPECGYHKMEEEIRDETLSCGGKHRNVKNLKGEFCPKCNEGVWDSESNKRLDKEQTELIDEVRRDCSNGDDSTGALGKRIII